MKSSLVKGAIAPLIAIMAILLGACSNVQAAVFPASTSIGKLTPQHLTTAFAHTVHADDGASVALPGGRTLWIGGDTTYIGRENICQQQPGACPFGPAHQTFVIQKGSKLTPLRQGNGGFNGWQQIPNKSDNEVFWAGGGVVYGRTLYVFAGEIKLLPVSVSCAPFCWVPQGERVAEFNARTLAYERIVSLHTSENIDSAVRDGNGWYVFASSSLPNTDNTMKQGDVAWVPLNGLAKGADYHWHMDAIDSQWTPGSMISAVHYEHRWVVFTKENDFMGGSIERLESSSPFGPFQYTGGWPGYGLQLPGVKQGEWSYSVQAHPEQPAPSGDVLVSYAVSPIDVSTGRDADYHLHFLYLPILKGEKQFLQPVRQLNRWLARTNAELTRACRSHDAWARKHREYCG